MIDRINTGKNQRTPLILKNLSPSQTIEAPDLLISPSVAIYLETFVVVCFAGRSVPSRTGF